MVKKRSVYLILILIFSSVTAFDEAYAHSMFNSAEQFEAGYRVQVATLPEFPQIGEPSQFLVKVTEGFEYNEVDRFTMGIRIFFNGQQVDTIPPKSIEGSHWDFDYVWRQQGNHIVKIDLYDMSGKEGIITYTFNMGTQSPFGIIFFSAIIVGALVFTGIMIYIYLPKIFKKSKL
ncbi:MAG: hypothetical protein OEM28_06010 [Nitrosopumilus sp.]|nr:hypothetical protein [Nitrosopumilus sp.]MDH3487495.1 hypothetical protein [Nitrosopumilus sp.]